jgi:NADH-quinone oxidoreductase subunit F
MVSVDSAASGTQTNEGSSVTSRYNELVRVADEEFKYWLNPLQPRIDVANDTSSLANGSDRIEQILKQAVAESGATIGIGHVHGYGIQSVHPTVSITWPNGTRILYGPVTPERCSDLIQEAQDGPNSHLQDLVIGQISGESGEIASIRDHPFFSCEPDERRLLANLGITDPDSLNHAIATGSYKATARIIGRRMPEGRVRDSLIAAGLTGRGGASFPTGVKWNFLAGAQGNDHYVVCNADEGDPGAWVNRVVMEGEPHSLIEGMLIAGLATGSRTGFIYLRDEYPLAIDRMERAIQNAINNQLLGKNILGSDLEFNLRVIRGAGAYVCGEETGLLSSIQDSRGMPRVKPPFPAQVGVFNLPSNVNNVETYATVPMILRHTSDWYKELGTESMSGTRVFSFSGDIAQVGFMELPFGTPLAKILDSCGGIHTPNGEHGKLYAIQSGGPLGSLLPSHSIDQLILENASFAPWDAIMGAGGIVFIGEGTHILVLNELFSEFVEEESCGRCTTCHGGNQRQTEIVRRIISGRGRRDDAPNLKLVDDLLQHSNCVHGQFSPKTMRNTLQHFRTDYEDAIAGYDPTLTLSGMYELEIVDQTDPLLNEAATICPKGQFEGEAGAWSINMSGCVRCGACIDIAPNAIQKKALARSPRVIPIA